MPKWKNNHVIVTGGAGFIGSHLVEKLLDLGNEVTVLDSFLYGNKICHLAGHKNLFIRKVDVRDAKAVCKATRGADIIFHLASLVGVEETSQHPLEVLDVEIEGTVNILSSALKNDIKNVVFASSSEVYGDFPGVAKEDGPLTPRSTYGYAKLIGEEYCKAYYREYGTEYVCLRYFNVYGPRQDSRFVIPRFVKRLLQNKPPLILGDGNQTRDFTYIEDAINMTMLAAIKPEAKCESINIGTGRSVTITELARLVIRILKKDNLVNPIFINYSKKRPREIEVYNRCADISKAKQVFGYEPNTSLEAGIKKCIDWYLSIRNKKSGVGQNVIS